MKWFKHDTDCDRSEGLTSLICEFGWAGYGRWFRLLEIVASKMDGSDRCWAEYPTKEWRQLLGLKQKKLSLFLKQTENKLKTKVVTYDNIIRIEVPNLLIKRDYYSSKFKHCSNNVLDKKEEVRSKKKEVRRKTNTKGAGKPAVDSFSLNGKSDQFKIAWRGFLSAREKKRKPATERAQFLLLAKLEKLSKNESTQIDIIDQSTIESWSSFYALKQDRGNPKNAIIV